MLRNKFDALQEISKTLNPIDKYENFMNAHMEAVGECIPTKLRAKHSSVGDIRRRKKRRKREKKHPYVIKGLMPALRSLRRHEVN